MSVEAPKPVEEAPAADITKALPEQPEATVAPTETSAAPVETAEPTPAAVDEPAAPVTEEVKKDEPVAEAVPASEGVLGYKEPTLFKKFFFTKHFFWFSEEPSTPESLSTFLRSEKADAKHSSSAWARETGKGLLFFSKRAEDKATPAGIIHLADASAVTKEGFNQFVFKAGSHQHRFEATTGKERDSWVLAIEKAIEEAKGLEEEITGRESYKKNVEEYSKPPVIAAAAVKTPRSKSKEPKKSLDATTATSAAATAPVVADNASSSSSSADEAKAKKERSQSRKRGSIFGTLLGKKEEHAEKKEEKAEVKKEVKEEKKAEAEEKKEEAKATEEPSKAVEAAEASAAATVPAAVIAADKKEDKEEATPVTEKKNKRGSVFGSLFKKGITSPASEKTEKEATASSDVPPVSETAPKLEEPIENKPIDTAAVTAPVDTVETPAATSEEPAKEVTATPAAAETSTAPKTEKKGGLLSFIKKTEAKLEGKKEHKEETKEEAKEEKAAETIAKDPVAAASAEPTEPVATEAVPETTATKEERPARDNKRRTSLFFNKKRTETSDAEDATAEPKREKSPLPGKFIGNLVRRASKAVKSEGPKEKTTAEPATTEEAPAASETPATVPETTESKITGDVVPDDLHAPIEPVATATPEVKATA